MSMGLNLVKMRVMEYLSGFDSPENYDSEWDWKSW